mgnify:CR=1 FL=1
MNTTNNQVDTTSEETPKAGQVWRCELWRCELRRCELIGVDYLITNDDHVSEWTDGTSRQWNLTHNKPAWFCVLPRSFTNWYKVAESLDHYYAPKQQPTVTQEMIERALRRLQDYREVTVDEHTLKGDSLVFNYDKTRSGDQCQKLAAALNEQLRERRK